MRSEYSHPSNIRVLLHTSRHSSMSHPAPYGKFILSLTFFSIVMEYADNGDVFQKICQYQQGGNLFKEKVVWKIFIQTVRGLKALHDLKILHRDMKSANIFLFKDYTAKLGDLNVSKVAKKGLLYT